MSKSAFYIYTYICINAINKCDALAYKFPTTLQEIEKAAQSFKAIRFNRVIEGCVAAMDGVLTNTVTPSKIES